MLTKVYLDGALGMEFGKEWELDINSAPEALQIIQANKPHLRAWMLEHGNVFNFYHVICEYFDGRIEELVNDTFMCLRKVKSIRFIPFFQGAGRAGKIIAGVALMIIGAVLSWCTGGSSLSLAAKGALIAIGTACSALGSSLLMTALMPRQKENKSDDNHSYYFNGATNTTRQGVPIPLVFGRLRAGSVVVSSSLDVQNTNSYSKGKIEKGVTTVGDRE